MAALPNFLNSDFVAWAEKNQDYTRRQSSKLKIFIKFHYGWVEIKNDGPEMG